MMAAAQSDDEGSNLDARAYTVPPKWVTLVTDMNADISSIKIKRVPPAVHVATAEAR